jgi:hypothetical protein
MTTLLLIIAVILLILLLIGVNKPRKPQFNYTWSTSIATTPTCPTTMSAGSCIRRPMAAQTASIRERCSCKSKV